MGGMEVTRGQAWTGNEGRVAKESRITSKTKIERHF